MYGSLSSSGVYWNVQWLSGGCSTIAKHIRSHSLAFSVLNNMHDTPSCWHQTTRILVSSTLFNWIQLNSIHHHWADFNTSTCVNVSTKNVWWKSHGAGCHCSAAACKPHTMSNSKCHMKWCKSHRHWTVEQWKRSMEGLITLFCLAVDGRVWVAKTSLPRELLPAWLHCADCEVWWRRDNSEGLFFRVSF